MSENKKEGPPERTWSTSFGGSRESKKSRVNPLYTLLSQHKDELLKKGIIVKYKTKRESPPLIIELDILQKNITIGSCKYTITENHCTFYENPPSTKIGYSSAIHYRMTVSDPEGNQFKIYLYLDYQGKVTISPALLPVDPEKHPKSNPIELTSTEQQRLYANGLDPTRNLLNQLFNLCQIQHDYWLAKDREILDEMDKINTLSSTQAQDQYKVLVEKRIEFLSEASKYSTRRKPRVLNLLENYESLANFQKEHQAPNSETPKINATQVADLKKIFKKKKKKKKIPSLEKRITEFTDDQNDFGAILAYILAKAPILEETKDKDEKKSLFIKLGKLFFNEGLPFYHASKNLIQRKTFEVMRFRFIANATLYCQKMNDEQLMIFSPTLLDSHLLSYISLPKSLLLLSIKKDNALLLRHLFEHEVYEIFEQATYVVENQPYTLLETAVHYKAVQCYEYLLKFGFSPYYFSGPRSPVALMEDDIEQAMLFASARTRTGNGILASDQTALYYERLIEMTDTTERREYLTEKKALSLAVSAYQSKTASKYKQQRLRSFQELSVITALKHLFPQITQTRLSSDRIKILAENFRIKTKLLDYVSPDIIATLEGKNQLRSMIDSVSGGMAPDIKLTTEDLQKTNALSIEMSVINNQLLSLTLQALESGDIGRVRPDGALLFKTRASKAKNSHNQKRALHLNRLEVLKNEMIAILVRKSKVVSETLQEINSDIFQATKNLQSVIRASNKVMVLHASITEELVGIDADIEKLQGYIKETGKPSLLKKMTVTLDKLYEEKEKLQVQKKDLLQTHTEAKKSITAGQKTLQRFTTFKEELQLKIGKTSLPGVTDFFSPSPSSSTQNDRSRSLPHSTNTTP